MMGKFDWIAEVNTILSKDEIGVEVRGGRAMSEVDIVLNHFSSNLSIINAIPETKQILFAYLRAMEKIAITLKELFRERMMIRMKSIPIKIGDKMYYLNPEDNTIYSEEEIRMIEQAYRYLQAALRQLGRKYLYTLLAGIPPEMEQKPQQPPEFQYVPLGMGYFYPPRQPEQPQEGERK